VIAADRALKTAVRTTGELCRKFGERILGEIVKHLRTKSSSPDAYTRVGVCLLLSELMSATSCISHGPSLTCAIRRTNSTDTQQEGHENDIISMIRTSLVDDEANVRTAAAQAFDVLQERLGAKAIDQTIPTLLEALRQPGESSGTALQALKEVMNVGDVSAWTVKHLLSHSGSSEHGVPSFDSDTYCCAHDRVQRKGFSIPGNRGRKCAEQATDCCPYRTCQHYGID
jgi:hypothetical protein